MRKHTHLLLAIAVVLVMPLTMQSGSLASEVLIFGLAAMGCNLLQATPGCCHSARASSLAWAATPLP